jgi:hypothetical protein
LNSRQTLIPMEIYSFGNTSTHHFCVLRLSFWPADSFEFRLGQRCLVVGGTY